MAAEGIRGAYDLSIEGKRMVRAIWRHTWPVGLTRGRGHGNRWWLAAGYGASAVAVALATALIAPLGELHLANTSMLYLIVVLLIAVRFGRGPAIFSAVTAFLAFNFFFTEPKYTFSVAEPDVWVALLLFLLTAVVTGHLAAGQRRRADEAEIHERHAQILYDVADAVAEPDLTVALQQIADRIRQELGAAGVRIELGADGPAGRTHASSVAAAPVSVVLEARDAGPMDVLAAAGARAQDPHWVRISPPHGTKRADSSAKYRLSRVAIESPQAEAGEILVATEGRAGLSGDDARLLASVARQLWVAVERARLRQEATEAEILRRSDEAKSALLDAVSHDLRTPLASIIASAGSLRDGAVDWSMDERQAFAQAIEQEARRLDRIVGDLLDVSRLRAGAIRADKAWYEPVALVREVAGRIRPMADRRRHVLRVDLPDELPPVPLDYSKVDQILTNLIENAVKFSPDGSEIRITAAMDGNSLRMSVEDNGSGLDAVTLDRVFEPFYRLRRSGPGGTGLGLAVASGLVAAHGGRIWAEPREGGGTRFVFTIPNEEDGG